MPARDMAARPFLEEQIKILLTVFAQYQAELPGQKSALISNMQELHRSLGKDKLTRIFFDGLRSKAIFDEIRRTGTVKQSTIEACHPDRITGSLEWNLGGVYVDLGPASSPLTASTGIYVGSGCSLKTNWTGGRQGLAHRCHNQHNNPSYRQSHPSCAHYQKGYGIDSEPHRYQCLWALSESDISSYLGYGVKSIYSTDDIQRSVAKELREALIVSMEAILIKILDVYHHALLDLMCLDAGYRPIRLQHPAYNRASGLEHGGDRITKANAKEMGRNGGIKGGRNGGIKAISANMLRWGALAGRPGEKMGLGAWERWMKGDEYMALKHKMMGDKKYLRDVRIMFDGLNGNGWKSAYYNKEGLKITESKTIVNAIQKIEFPGVPSNLIPSSGVRIFLRCLKHTMPATTQLRWWLINPGLVFDPYRCTLLGWSENEVGRMTKIVTLDAASMDTVKARPRCLNDLQKWIVAIKALELMWNLLLDSE
ncbi:hypothetical protein I316_02962 [Kwoniella heveanensis BCC8398]|uniref:Uncharacterized protein n=1 Tax=Kwoniella heveanensis BCC8398 TaxID=1296120 RepID=A0A1B9GWJ6_9TREE|nr:hypothetical protein I316_02962 [Kwoniella heveanensis BCC8398]